MKLIAPLLIATFGFLLGWLVRDWAGHNTESHNIASVAEPSDKEAQYTGQSTSSSPTLRTAQYPDVEAAARPSSAESKEAENSKNGSEAIVVRFERYLSANNVFEALRLLEQNATNLSEQERSQMGSSFTAFVTRQGIDNHLTSRDGRKLESLLASLDRYSPSAQFFDIVDLTDSEPFVALSDFDALAGYYQEQVSEDQLEQLEDWLVSRVESNFESAGDWRNLESWLQALVSRASDPTDAYSKLAAFYYERERFASSLETLDKISGSGGLNSKARELYDLNTQSIASRAATSIPLQPNGEHYIVNIELDSRVRVPLLLDTGASVTSIDRDFAVRQNFRFNGRSAGFATAGGRIRSDLLDMETLQLGNRLLRDLELATIDFGVSSSGAQYYGLLGMDVLGQFQFYIDQREAVLHLWEF